MLAAMDLRLAMLCPRGEAQELRFTTIRQDSNHKRLTNGVLNRFAEFVVKHSNLLPSI